MGGIKSKQEKIFAAAAHVVMIILSVSALAPFWLLVASSFTSNDALTRYGYNFWPKEFSLESYQYILSEWGQIGHAYLITIAVTAIGTVISLILVSTMGTGLAQKDVPGLSVVFVFVLITMLFNGGVVSSYIIYTQIFHIKNTIWALIIPNLMLSGFNIVLVKNYVQNSIPAELEEAAEIDGASVYKI
ncbi:MAG: ABC transporter permease subunit [Lachnospiraceae bacterium]|nr:ABC transporter permease subunit [Lachnospiraceae bacterium]